MRTYRPHCSIVIEIRVTFREVLSPEAEARRRVVHRRIVFAVSAVLFSLLAAAAVIVADLHDRGYPAQLGAKSAVDLDFSESGMSDAEAFRQLGMLSDHLEIGLVKVAPDLSGNQSGQVFVAVGDQDSFPDSIQRFGNQPDAQASGKNMARSCSRITA
jgi:hypothetical protein